MKVKKSCLAYFKPREERFHVSTSLPMTICLNCLEIVKTLGKLTNILKNVSGYALPGMTHYIMGASGAGKSTLINALASRINKSGSKLTGRVTFNTNTEVNEKNFGKYAAYVMQDDILFQYFTVGECLHFAARLKLSNLTLQ